MISDFDEYRASVVSLTTSKISEPVDTIKDELETLIRNNAGQPAATLSKLIDDQFEFYSTARAEVIGRTTATFTTGASQTKVWDDLDIDYSWLSQRNASVRDTHRRADGQRPDADGYFYVGRDKMKFPASGKLAEENVNCQCVLQPVASERGVRRIEYGT